MRILDCGQEGEGSTLLAVANSDWYRPEIID